MAMPERIWVGPRAEIGKPMGGDWYSIRTPGTPVQYVSATTHQRTLEALREAVAEALEARAQYFDRAKGYREWEDAARSYRATAKDVDKAITAALARIKEATDAER